MLCCGACGRPATKEMLETHHRKPRNTGGGDSPDNLIDLCSDCHTSAHILARMMQKKDVSMKGRIQDFLDTNYPGNRKAHEILIELAKTIVLEEENAGPKQAINVFLKPNRVLHQKLKDMARASKVSMVDFIYNLIEAEHRRRQKL